MNEASYPLDQSFVNNRYVGDHTQPLYCEIFWVQYLFNAKLIKMTKPYYSVCFDCFLVSFGFLGFWVFFGFAAILSDILLVSKAELSNRREVHPLSIEHSL